MKASAAVNRTSRPSTPLSATKVKRLKTSQACEVCRNRRVRCDGAKPSCGACRRRRKQHTPCRYMENRAAGVPAEYVEHLERRVKQLESEQHDDSNGLASNTERLYGGTDESPEMAKFFNNANAMPDAIHADAMGNFASTELDSPEARSSAASFVAQVKTAMAAKLSSLASSSSSDATPRDLPDPWTDHQLNLLGRNRIDIFSLPSRQSANDMLAVYWDQIHVLYPFLLRERFELAYTRVWSRTHTDTSKVPIYCHLNLVFALACQFTKKEAPQEKAVLADLYYRRAALLLQASGIGRCSPELLQALLLMSQFLQSTEWPRRCWVVIGQAIRTAQALGLHVPSTTSGLPQQDKQLLRRLWHGCVFFDRLISMALGRPMVVSRAEAAAVPLPEQIDDTLLSPVLSTSGVQASGKVSHASFFVHAIKMVGLLERVLSDIYSTDEAGSRRVNTSTADRLQCLDFSVIVQIDAAFQGWEEALPAELKLGEQGRDSSDAIIFRQARILRLRYLQFRILLFRPVLSLLLAPEVRSRALRAGGGSFQSWLPMAMALPCAHECIKNALETIHIIHHQHNWPGDNTFAPLPSWWFSVFFIYTAATVLIPARAYSYIRGDIPQSELLQAWQRAVEVLQWLSPTSPSAVSCIAALQTLDDALVFEAGSSTFTEPPHPSQEAANTTQTPVVIPVSGTKPQPATEESEMFSADNMYAMLETQDFSWLDALPLDMLSTDQADMPDLWQGVW